MLNRYVNVAHHNLEHIIVTSEFVGSNIYCFMLLFLFYCRLFFVMVGVVLDGSHPDLFMN
jgi:hypothetical protein